MIPVNFQQLVIRINFESRMIEQAVLFPGQDTRFVADGAVGKLELMTRGLAEPLPEKNEWLVVICHPHPEHGGTMDNKVVTTLARAAREAGLDSLRFNYRGVGQSEGSYGEFDGECDDFDAVMRWVAQNTRKTRFLLAGFSFGSAVIANRAESVQGLEHLLLLAPPVERYLYPNRFSAPVKVIQGTADEVVDYKAVTRWAEGIETPFEYLLVGECSHFFHGRLIDLRERLVPLFSAIAS